MSTLQQDSSTPEQVVLSFEEGLYPLEAIYGAAYVFIDRCFVLLDRPVPGRISVRLRRKPGVTAPAEALAGELENELLGQAWRLLLVAENRDLLQDVAARALSGAAGPAGLDDLLGEDIGDDTAFEDPLGIALSWEEKYKKKAPEAGPQGEP